MGWGNPVAGGTVMTIPALQSPDFTHLVSGWQLNQDGTFEANDAIIRGTITAGEFAGTSFIIDASGAFFYSGTPALGNLVASIASAAGADSFGNAYPAGIMTQSSAGNQVVLTGNAIELFSSASAPGEQSLITAFSGGDLLISGPGTGSADTTAFFDLLSENTTGSVPMLVMGNQGLGATILAANQPGGAIRTPETWHAVSSLPTGWTALGAGVRYRLMPDNSVRFQISASIGAAAASGTVTLVTLPAGYVPAKQFRGCSPGLFTGNASWATGILNSRFQVTTGGVAEILGFPGGGANGVTEIDGQWDIPLD